MKLGITFDLKDAAAARPGLPDDFQEEYDSPSTISAIADVLGNLGHTVTQLGDGRELLKKLLADPPEFVFNIAEGQGIGRSREARVPAVLEMLGIRYTGSDPLTLAVSLDKNCAKRLVHAAGVKVPRGRVVGPDDSLVQLQQSDLRYPALVKPAWEGSSKGIRSKCLVDRVDDLPNVVNAIRKDHRQPVLIEEFVDGEELTVGVIGNSPAKVLGIMRVIPLQPGRFIYSLEVKRDWQNRVRYECPARLPPETLSAVETAALTAYQALGCRDVARVDFRVRQGVPYFLEVNPLPGLNPDSGDLVIMAREIGWSYPRLIETIFRCAEDRFRSDVTCW